jgi:hypothetical protein
MLLQYLGPGNLSLSGHKHVSLFTALSMFGVKHTYRDWPVSLNMRNKTKIPKATIIFTTRFKATEIFEDSDSQIRMLYDLGYTLETIPT